MFYQSIASVYDFIFPQNKKQLSFIEKIIPLNHTDRILDIGCATGNLTALLKSKTPHVIGLDLDSDLLDQARIKYPHYDFIEENMLYINERFSEKFNHIISFGNTLVHLPSRDDVQIFFNQVYKLLNSDGYFITQIINYDRIISKSIDHLPTIDNDHIKFVRTYNHHKDYVDFVTELTIKDSQQIISNSIPLLALRKKELESMLKKSGFVDILFYGNLDGDALTDQDTPLIFSCKKVL